MVCDSVLDATYIYPTHGDQLLQMAVDILEGKPYDKAVHTVTLEGPLKDLLGKAELSVNSLHHQAIRKLAPGWIPEASSPDGLIEAAVLPGKRFFRAVQWHPEYLFEKDEDSLALFVAFVKAC